MLLNSIIQEVAALIIKLPNISYNAPISIPYVFSDTFILYFSDRQVLLLDFLWRAVMKDGTNLNDA